MVKNDVEKKRKDVQKVLKLMDEFSFYHELIPHLGPEKVLQPHWVLQLGCRQGYAALWVTPWLPLNATLVLIESKSENLHVACDMLHTAQVTTKVLFIHGCSSEKLPQLRSEFLVTSFHLVLMTHNTNSFRQDLELLLSLALLAPGAIVLADHAPRPLLRAARCSGRFDVRTRPAMLQYEPRLRDGVAQLNFLG
uniref:transmembrane O-methyltransferase homolog n=1 Tax=Myxine glutinosa TaxID=7769 RepID=UPI00358F2CAE